MMGQFEREFWQAIVQFGHGAAVSPEEFAALFGGAKNLLPGEDMQWQMPALTGSPFNFEVVGVGGVGGPAAPNFLTGASRRGWIVQISGRQILVRHQQVVAAGRRAVEPAEFPDAAKFSRVLLQVFDALPGPLRTAANFVELTVNYAMFTDDFYPPSVAAEMLGKGTRAKTPPPDGARLVPQHLEMEFQTIGGRRYVWNDTTYIGNWFGSDGVLLENAAVVRSMDLKTALAEPVKASPVSVPWIVPALPPLSQANVLDFFAPDRGIGVPLLIERLRSSLPKGVEVHE